MLRACSIFAALELFLIAICVGAPHAYADPAEECCGADRSAECSGCLSGYNLGTGSLFGCQLGGQQQGCSLESMWCNGAFGDLDKYVVGSNCTIFQEKSSGIEIWKDGCAQTECD